MKMYQHDHPHAFRFSLSGDLDDDAVRELEYAWQTATSVLTGKELLIEVSGITSLTEAGLKLLERMQESGARLDAAATPQLAELARRVGVRTPTESPGRRLRARVAAWLPRTARSKP